MNEHDARGAEQPDPEPLEPKDSLWHDEFLAGFWDGRRAGEIEALNLLRVELARFHFEVGDRLDVSVTSGAPRFEPVPVPRPDNAEGHPGYTEGWQQGFDERWAAVVDEVRGQVLAEGVFVSDSGQAMTTAAVSELADLFHGFARDTRPVEIQDQDLHALLDDALASHERRPLERRPAGDAAAAPGAAPVRRSRHVARTARRVPIDRRTAVVAMIAAFAGGIVHWRWSQRSEPVPPGRPSLQDPTGYVPPTTWSGYPTELEQTYLAWDQAFWSAEAINNHAAVTAVVSEIMRSVGNDGIKDLLAGFVVDSSRHYLLPTLPLALDVVRTEAMTRVSVLGSLNRAFDGFGPTVFSSAMVDALRHHRAQLGDAPRVLQRSLDTLLGKLGY